MSDENKVRNQIWKHIMRVRELLGMFNHSLINRGILHDNSKMESPEIEKFVEYVPKLSKLTYGSDEYKECLKGLGPALTHHYKTHRHHPEYHEDGINSMNLIDIVEMFMDWKAASEQHDDGDIMKSIDINAERFGISPQLTAILKNTALALLINNPKEG